MHSTPEDYRIRAVIIGNYLYLFLLKYKSFFDFYSFKVMSFIEIDQ